MHYRGKFSYRPARKIIVALVVFFVLAVLAYQSARADDSYKDPIGPIGTDTTARPVTSGGMAETKAGPLVIQGNVTIINGQTAAVGAGNKLCLNPAGGAGCIGDWSELTNGLVKLFPGSVISPDKIQMGNVDVQARTVEKDIFAIQGKARNASGKGVVGTVSNTALALSAGIFGSAPPGSLAWAGFFDGLGSGTGPLKKAAVRIEDADSKRETIEDRRLTVGTPDKKGDICLYGDGSEQCLDSWSADTLNYKNPNSSLMFLQYRNFNSDGSPDSAKQMIAQNGNVRINGSVKFGSVVVGTPLTAAPACGDGLCSGPENNALCPVDCPLLVSPPSPTVTVSDIRATSAHVAWKTNPATTTQASQGQTSAIFNQVVTNSPALTTVHNIDVTGLTSNTRYYVRIVGITASGSTLSTTISFTTAI